ncbi:2,5-diamino-6-ribosylamino-4(3H)-pyrimidinone 5'-phosphate reductase [Fusarium sp. LHS14.1]|nr:2,5-diamino-6-ribosylamino-4(3H)-pyrimidinone 5'-phosphate reductase [Fusarium sp. LHS14.1]
MPQLRYNVATSLDGYIASSDGSADWIVDDPTIDFKALYEQFDFFVMGRKTRCALIDSDLAVGRVDASKEMPVNTLSPITAPFLMRDHVPPLTGLSHVGLSDDNDDWINEGQAF